VLPSGANQVRTGVQLAPIGLITASDLAGLTMIDMSVDS
jgi:hypothetical protein